MKALRWLLPLALIAPALAQAQSFAVDWFTIDSGGGTSSGGTYSLSGTIGQPDAGRLTGGSYTLEGGFWGIQGFATPLLRIERLGPTVRVFWPASSAGYLLDEAASLGSWFQVTTGLQTNSTDISLSLTPPVGTKFYRLRKP